MPEATIHRLDESGEDTDAMLAELERDFVSERTKEGLRARREQGKTMFRPVELIVFLLLVNGLFLLLGVISLVVGAIGIHLAERGGNPAFDTWIESLMWWMK